MMKPALRLLLVKGPENTWRKLALTICWSEEEMKAKVIVLRELQRAIVYTRELNKEAIEGHVSTVYIVYSVNKGARLTQS
jgi:hypothetical protein